MNKLFSLLVLLGSLLHLTCAQQHVAEEIQHKNFTSLSEALADAEKYILHFNATYNFPSVAFGLSVKGKPVLRKAWGLAELENYVPAQINTKYRIASISKTFTSVIVGQLVDRGVLHYDDSIWKYLPESLFPKKEWPVGSGQKVEITIRNLLSHTAGTHVSSLPFDLFQVQMAQNVTQTIPQFAAEPLHFKPGTNFTYSNFGFQLLGAIIESVTKKPCQVVMSEFMHQNGLHSSYVGNGSVVLHNLPRYYISLNESNPRENTPTAPYDELVFIEGNWPAGGVTSTVDDLLHYGQLLIDAYKGRPNAIISSKTLKEMWHPSTPAHIPATFTSQLGTKSDYGLGWIIAQPNHKLVHQKAIWHSGGLIGLTSLLVIHPEEELVAVAFTNKGGVPVLEQMAVNAVENVVPLVK